MGNWVLDTESGRTRTQHLDGVPWWEAKIPRRFHRCRPQTRGLVRTPIAVLRVQRCACGAIERGEGWQDRNSRRKEKRK